MYVRVLIHPTIGLGFQSDAEEIPDSDIEKFKELLSSFMEYRVFSMDVQGRKRYYNTDHILYIDLELSEDGWDE